MHDSDMTQTICGGLISVLFYIVFFLMFGWATWNGDLIFHGGRIRGRLARVIGVIGLLGITAGAYLGISFFVFNLEPPFAGVASFLFGLFVIVVLVVRFLSIFFWRSK